MLGIFVFWHEIIPEYSQICGNFCHIFWWLRVIFCIVYDLWAWRKLHYMQIWRSGVKNSALVMLRGCLRFSKFNDNHHYSKWKHIQIKFSGIRNFGKDFQAIAEIIGTKTKIQVRDFYNQRRKRSNLDLLLQDHETEYELLPEGNDSIDNVKMTTVSIETNSPICFALLFVTRWFHSLVTSDGSGWNFIGQRWCTQFKLVAFVTARKYK